MSRFNDILRILETITIDEEYYALPEIEFNTEEESLLIHRTLMGDDDAFAKIVAAHYRMVFNIGYRYLNNMEEAEDLTQEVFLRIYRFLSRFKGESSLKTWIYRITVNSALNRTQWLKRRKHKKQISIDTAPNEDDQPMNERLKSTEAGPESGTLSNELQLEIQKGLSKLPKKLRMAVILRDVEGLSYIEISKSLRINIGTVKSRIARGRLMMRGFLSEYVEG
jgi:RNA polymerase sigma-70 factor (ECF subfamily)